LLDNIPTKRVNIVYAELRCTTIEVVYHFDMMFCFLKHWWSWQVCGLNYLTWTDTMCLGTLGFRVLDVRP